MAQRFELRKEAMLAECEVSPEVFRGVEGCLVNFAEPFVELLTQRAHAGDYLSGMISDLERKNVESIAYRHEQALQMLDEQGGLLPHAWVAGDDEMGRNVAFRVICASGTSVTCSPFRATL